MVNFSQIRIYIKKISLQVPTLNKERFCQRSPNLLRLLEYITLTYKNKYLHLHKVPKKF